jgi:hypothetical protein
MSNQVVPYRRPFGFNCAELIIFADEALSSEPPFDESPTPLNRRLLPGKSMITAELRRTLFALGWPAHCPVESQFAKPVRFVHFCDCPTVDSHFEKGISAHGFWAPE